MRVVPGRNLEVLPITMSFHDLNFTKLSSIPASQLFGCIKNAFIIVNEMETYLEEG